MNRIRPRSFGFAIRSIPRDVAYRLGLLGLDWHCATVARLCFLSAHDHAAISSDGFQPDYSCRTSLDDGHNRVYLRTPRVDPRPLIGRG